MCNVWVFMCGVCVNVYVCSLCLWRSAYTQKSVSIFTLFFKTGTLTELGTHQESSCLELPMTAITDVYHSSNKGPRDLI